MDATYRADLRELNELKFARFDAKLEQRIAGVEARIDGLEAKIKGSEVRLEARLETGRAQLEARLEKRIGDVRVELLRWMFVFWAGTVVPLGALIFALRRG